MKPGKKGPILRVFYSRAVRSLSQKEGRNLLALAGKGKRKAGAIAGGTVNSC